ncbi:MAG: FAD-dependent oxidoreductase, partial [Acidobacteriota bacterium]
MDDNQGALAGSKTDKPGLSRRTLLHAATLHAAALGTGLTAAPLAASESTARRRRPVVVIGAGAFGGWTALWLQRQGADVTLIDTWGPGHSRASSGGESRVIRGMYGVDRVYTEWVVRAFEIWRDSARRWDADLYHPTGALWMFRGDDGYARASAPVLADAGLIAEPLTRKTARQRYPHIDFTGIEHLWYEAEAGYLTARRACRRVAQALVEEGGELRSAHVRPGPLDNGQMEYIELDNGERIHADAYVFACGPWLGDLFPDVIGDKINPSRQDVFYFGPPAGNHAFAEGRFPVWIDFGERIFYGVPG